MKYYDIFHSKKEAGDHELKKQQSSAIQQTRRIVKLRE
jgi:hypothetical protein